MKKNLFLIVIIIFITGCGIIKNSDFNTKCFKSLKSNGLIYNQNIELVFDGDDIKKVIITDEYTSTNNIGTNALEASKIGHEDYIRTKKSINGFEQLEKTDEKNYYKYKYQLNFEIMTDEDISLFSMTKDYLKQIKVYKEEMNCK